MWLGHELFQKMQLSVCHNNKHLQCSSKHLPITTSNNAANLHCNWNTFVNTCQAHKTSTTTKLPSNECKVDLNSWIHQLLYIYILWSPSDLSFRQRILGTTSCPSLCRFIQWSSQVIVTMTRGLNLVLEFILDEELSWHWLKPLMIENWSTLVHISINWKKKLVKVA